MGFYRGPNIVTDGLVLAYDAGSERCYSGSGTSLVNITSTGIPGALVNGPSFSTNGAGSWVFDGVDERILATPAGATVFGDQLVFEVWIYPTDYATSGGNRQYLIDPRGDGGTSGMSCYFLFDYRTSPDIVRITSGNNDVEVLSSDFQMTLNNWHHIVATRNGSSWVMYHNGVSVGTGTTNTTSLTLNNAFRIATFASGSSGQYFFEGNMAIARMYNQSQTAAQVLQNFNAQKSRFGL